MPLFREQRGGLSESLETTVIVNNKEDLLKHLKSVWSIWNVPMKPRQILYHDPTIKIEPYGGFDRRCGWYTQLVTCDILIKDQFIPMGFLSEPLDD